MPFCHNCFWSQFRARIGMILFVRFLSLIFFCQWTLLLWLWNYVTLLPLPSSFLFLSVQFLFWLIFLFSFRTHFELLVDVPVWPFSLQHLRHDLHRHPLRKRHRNFFLFLEIIQIRVVQSIFKCIRVHTFTDL